MINALVAIIDTHVKQNVLLKIANNVTKTMYAKAVKWDST